MLSSDSPYGEPVCVDFNKFHLTQPTSLPKKMQNIMELLGKILTWLFMTPLLGLLTVVCLPTLQLEL